MTSKVKKTLAERAKSGDYTLVEPIDTKIMEMLKDEGTLYAGLYPLGHTSVSLAEHFSTKEAKVKPYSIAVRLRVLQEQGLVIKLKSMQGGGGTWVFQRTKRAVELLNKRGGNGNRAQGG